MENALEHEQSIRKPLVAIVGRPNVGKSTLFNRLIGERKSIVEDVPGVTRDRIYADTEWDGIGFSLIDTGGFNPEDEELYPSLIKEQIQSAIEESDLILFVLDGKEGAMPHDLDVTRLLRKMRKQVIYIVNKIDHKKHEIAGLEFHSLGINKYIHVSALQGRNINTLLDNVISFIKMLDIKVEVDAEENEDTIRIAVLGKPNVGKSTLINRFLGEDRLITSPLPGTTRDTIDIHFRRDGKEYILIDTAGVRRKSRINFPVERHSVFRAIRAIERADVVLLMIEAEAGPTHQDSRLARLVADKGRACIVLLNKWDLAPSNVVEEPNVVEILKDNLTAVDFAPVLIISALTGRGVHKIFDKVDNVFRNFSQRIPTKKLNYFLQKTARTSPPPIYKGREIKFYYVSQSLTKQPTFVIFTNKIEGIPTNYKRFLENQLRQEFDFEGTSIKLIFKSARKKD